MTSRRRFVSGHWIRGASWCRCDCPATRGHSPEPAPCRLRVLAVPTSNRSVAGLVFVLLTNYFPSWSCFSSLTDAPTTMSPMILRGKR